MTYDEHDAVKLEMAVSGSEEDLQNLKDIIFRAMFSVSRDNRMNYVIELNEQLDRRLKRCYYKRGNIFLDVNVEGNIRTIDNCDN